MEKYKNDPFMNRERVKDRLRNEFRKYGKLIIAYDFDYTVHNFHNEGYSYEFVSELLRRWYICTGSCDCRNNGEQFLDRHHFICN